MSTRHIEVWYDKTSDPEEPMYCVSLCEADGEEVKCLSTHEERPAAVSAGQQAAKKRDLKLVERD
jgi:hypothetical protein